MKIGVFFDHLRVASDQTSLPLEKIAREAVQMGIEFVHVNGEFWMDNEERVDTLLEMAGLQVGSVDFMCQLTRGEDIAETERMIRFLSRKNVKHLLLIPGFMHEAQSRQSAMDQIAVHMKELLYFARSMHVQCSIEDFDHASAPYGTWQELLWYTQKLPELKVCFDTGNFMYHGQDEKEAYENLTGTICMVHAKDRSFLGREGDKPLKTQNGKALYPCAVGRGEVKMAELIACLKQDHYHGGIIIEHFDSADMFGDMRKSAEWLMKEIHKS